MTHFEYISVIVSVILGLGIVRLLGSLDQVFSAQRYWPHALWVVTIFWMQVQNWWAFWGMRTVEFNVLLYSVWIGFASLLYLTTVSLTNRESSDVAWKEHFYARRKWFFTIVMLSLTTAVFVSFIFFGASLTHPYRALQLFGIVLAGVGLFSAQERLHKSVSVLFFLVVTVGVSLFRFLPDLFVSPLD